MINELIADRVQWSNLRIDAKLTSLLSRLDLGFANGVDS